MNSCSTARDIQGSKEAKSGRERVGADQHGTLANCPGLKEHGPLVKDSSTRPTTHADYSGAVLKWVNTGERIDELGRAGPAKACRSEATGAEFGTRESVSHVYDDRAVERRPTTMTRHTHTHNLCTKAQTRSCAHTHSATVCLPIPLSKTKISRF